MIVVNAPGPDSRLSLLNWMCAGLSLVGDASLARQLQGTEQAGAGSDPAARLQRAAGSFTFVCLQPLCNLQRLCKSVTALRSVGGWSGPVFVLTDRPELSCQVSSDVAVICGHCVTMIQYFWRTPGHSGRCLSFMRRLRLKYFESHCVCNRCPRLWCTRRRVTMQESVHLQQSPCKYCRLAWR